MIVSVVDQIVCEALAKSNYFINALLHDVVCRFILILFLFKINNKKQDSRILFIYKTLQQYVKEKLCQLWESITKYTRYVISTRE